MGKVAVLGEGHRIQTFVLAGAEPHPARTDEEALAAWSELDPDVAVLILTPEAAGALAERLGERRQLLVTVLP